MSNNKNIVLITGKPNSGKSSALLGLSNPKEWAYFNTDLKELPFKDNFALNEEVKTATDIVSYIAEVEKETSVTGAVLDTLTFLMSMYERQNVIGAPNGQSAWQGYGVFYQNLIHQIKAGTKNYAILAHEHSELNEQAMTMESFVPIKGAVGKIGVHGDFTTILAAKQMPLKKLEGIENDLLNITDDEKEDGFKYVLCTRITKETVGEMTRSAIGLWDRNELYIDNNLDHVFNRLNKFYT